MASIEKGSSLKYVSSYGEPSDPDFVLPNIITITKSTSKYNYTQKKPETRACRRVPKRTINPEAFINLLFALPPNIMNLADITNYIFNSSEKYSLQGHYEFHDDKSFNFQKHYTIGTSDIGEIVIKLMHKEIAEFTKTPECVKIMEAVIHGVIYYNHKYYALTIVLNDWIKSNIAHHPELIELRRHIFYL